ncbi:MAG: chorismate mutase [Armatimonadetes bacterium]|nr:chorismate mutase [Anaerolineae bacterium]
MTMSEWLCRGVRGATTVHSNSADEIISATIELLKAMVEANGIAEQHVASVIFTTTPDLNAAFPAQAARQMGWQQVALLGAQEIDHPNGLPYAIRVLIHWNTAKRLDELVHVYMHGAEKLRPDLLYPKNKLVVEENVNENMQENIEEDPEL